LRDAVHGIDRWTPSAPSESPWWTVSMRMKSARPSGWGARRMAIVLRSLRVLSIRSRRWRRSARGRYSRVPDSRPRTTPVQTCPISRVNCAGNSPVTWPRKVLRRVLSARRRRFQPSRARTPLHQGVAPGRAIQYPERHIGRPRHELLYLGQGRQPCIQHVDHHALMIDPPPLAIPRWISRPPFGLIRRWKGR